MKKIFFRIKLRFTKILTQIHQGEMGLVAGSLSFSTLLTIIPFIALVLVSIKFFGSFDFLYPKVETLILSYFKEAAGRDASQALRGILDQLTSKQLGSASVLFLLFSSFKLIYSLEYAVHKIWNRKNIRPPEFRLFFHLVLFTTIPLALALFAGMKSMNFIDGNKELNLSLIEFIFFFISMLIFNKFLPSFHVNWKPTLSSSLFISITLSITQNSFKWTVLKMFNYSKVYGSLVSLPLLLLWIYIMWSIVLFGVVLCASFHDDENINLVE